MLLGAVNSMAIKDDLLAIAIAIAIEGEVKKIHGAILKDIIKQELQKS